MSIFESVQLDCPECGKPVAFQVVHSVNADRRPDLRAAILARRFQREACSACGTTFRLDPSFVYIDLKRGQWVAAHPVNALAAWPAREAEMRALFESSYGATAPRSVQRMGARLKPRLVFGWSALREKIVAAEAGLDDAVVEMLKMMAMAHAPDAPFSGAASVRLMAAQPHRLLLGWVRNHDDAMGDLRWVERALYDEVAAEAALGAESDWAEVVAAFSGALLVDVDRLLVAADAA